MGLLTGTEFFQGHSLSKYLLSVSCQATFLASGYKDKAWLLALRNCEWREKYIV